MSLLTRIFTRKKEPKKQHKNPFNAVLEGVCYDNIRGSHLKLVNIKVPEGVSQIDDRERRYQIYARTNFRERFEIATNPGKELISLESLSWYPGVILPGGSLFQVLDTIRAIFLRDGRVFVNLDLPQEYFRYVDELAKIIGESSLFEKLEYQRLYEKYAQR